MTAAVDVVQLKRRVRNAETELFEWHRCQCRVSGDGLLELALVDDDDAVNDRLQIDLARQLQSVEQKRKCKTRCELRYVVADRRDREVRSEQLMAPSPRHCEQWIELLREAEKRAKRRQSIREGTATASAVAAMNTLASSSGSSATAALPASTPFDASLSSVSASSRVSSSTPPTLVASAARAKAPTGPARRAGSQTATRYDEGDEEDQDDDEEEPPSPTNASATAPLPREMFAQKLEAVRHLLPLDPHEATFNIDDSVEESQQRDCDDAELYESEDDESYAHVEARRTRKQAPRPTLAPPMPRRKKPQLVVSPSSATSSRVTTAPVRRLLSPHSAPSVSSVPRRLRPSSATLETHHSRGLAPSARRSPSTGRSSAAAVAASIQRLRRRDHRGDDLDDRDGTAELDILVRVETALRHLERENAAAKEREAALAHQVSTLQDALRVRAAEKKHLESHAQQLARDKEQWKQAAQRAERALVQLQDELAIAHEETQLQHSERHRLQHQNKELLSQVHRLDSIVYGRF